MNLIGFFEVSEGFNKKQHLNHNINRLTMENRDRESRIDRIMTSVDGLQKATAPDFFYTRLAGRMQRELDEKHKPFFVLRPVFATAALSILLVVNIIFLTQRNTQPAKDTTVRSDKPATIESFAKAYDMDASSLYE
jgi:hypothetical protein